MAFERRTGIEPARSIDPQEVAFYQRLAHTWWDTAGPFWPIHTLNTLRVRYLAKQITAHFRRPADQQGLNGLRVLDVGCGGGVLSESIARLGAEVVGIDVADRNLRVAGLHADRSGLEIQYRLATAEQLAAAGLADGDSRRGICFALAAPGNSPLAKIAQTRGSDDAARAGRAASD